MDSIEIPPEAAAGRAYCDRQLVGPPPGVADSECGTVQMLSEPPGFCDRAVGQAHYAYFQPDENELALLCAGGFLELALYGQQIQPFGLAAWPGSAPPSSAVEVSAVPVLQPAELAAAIDAALLGLWPGEGDAAVSSRRVYRPVVAIALEAAVPAIGAAIADRLHPHRFDYLKAEAGHPDTFYSGAVQAEALVRAITAAPDPEGSTAAPTPG